MLNYSRYVNYLKNYRKFLVHELERRKERNKLYSLRAFARDLGVPSSRLSEILNGKVGLSSTKAYQYAKNLNLSKQDTELFIDLVESEHARSHIAKQLAKERLKGRIETYNTLNEDKFHVISDWYHFAIMEYITLENSIHTPKDIAQKLKITVQNASDALERLENLKLVKKENERYILNEVHNATTNDVPSQALKNYNKQILNKALNAIDEKHILERDTTAAIFTFNKKDLDEVKVKIREFRRKLMQEFEVKSGRNSVYCLGIQFFELTEGDSEGDN